jgi:SAM-dependent methyltransferase
VHAQAYDFVARCASGITAPVEVLEIGSCDVNGGVRSLFPTASRYHGIDVVAGPGVDEVADAAAWHTPAAFDVVVSTEVLEHAPRWAAVVHNAWEALRPGGRLILTCAAEPRILHSAVDGWDVRPGEHYGNVDPAALLTVVRRLGPDRWTVEHHGDRGDLYLEAWRPTEVRTPSVRATPGT